MKVLILTSSRYGTAAHHLPYLLDRKVCDVAMVILSEGAVGKKRIQIRKKVLKLWRIGLLGAINGIRMRAWYDQDVNEYKQINDIETICQINKIPFYKTDSINSLTTEKLFIDADVDLGISLGNSYIGEKIFKIPKYGMINIHHEILPEYQNAQSIIWQIYNMSTNTGYTIHKIDRRIDTGEILYQESIPINFLDTLGQTVTKTYISLFEASALGLLHVIENFESLYKNAKPQGIGKTYTTPSFKQFLIILRNFKRLKQKSNKKIDKKG